MLACTPFSTSVETLVSVCSAVGSAPMLLLTSVKTCDIVRNIGTRHVPGHVRCVHGDGLIDINMWH